MEVEAQKDFMFPALACLGELRKLRPTIVMDSREQRPLPFERLKTVVGTLVTGDYSVAGLENLFAVERKTIDDLAGCCIGQNRERFERELHRLRGFGFRRLLVIGREEDIHLGRYHSSITPKAVLATLAAFEARYDLPVVFSPTPMQAAALVEKWSIWFAREIVLQAKALLRADTNREEDDNGQCS